MNPQNGKHSAATNLRVLSVVGARPQFVKAAMLSRALATAGITEILVHTGQHYDESLSGSFFTELPLPQPHYNLAIGSGSHAQQTAAILERLDPVLATEAPQAVIVYGDTNSTLAGALVAAKRHIPVIHVEAGMRSFDRAQPEEINRVVADHLSELLLCVTPSASENLAREGITKGVVHIGDPMLDALLLIRSQASPGELLERYGLAKHNYVLADNPSS